MLGIASAFAQDAAQTVDPQQSILANLVPLVLVIVVFYFLIIRPQQKRMRQHQEMISSLRRGDRVVTSGGIVGVVAKIEDDQHVLVEIAPELKVKVVRSTISQVVSKGAEGAKEAAPANDTVTAKAKPAAKARKK